MIFINSYFSFKEKLSHTIQYPQRLNLTLRLNGFALPNSVKIEKTRTKRTAIKSIPT